MYSIITYNALSDQMNSRLMKKQYDKVCQTSSLSSQNSHGSELERTKLKLEKTQKLLEEEKLMMKRISNQNSRENNSQIKSNSGNFVNM